MTQVLKAPGCLTMPVQALDPPHVRNCFLSHNLVWSRFKALLYTGFEDPEMLTWGQASNARQEKEEDKQKPTRREAFSDFLSRIWFLSGTPELFCPEPLCKRPYETKGPWNGTETSESQEIQAQILEIYLMLSLKWYLSM
jgi:hypothetical protein